jgi:stearoyl-CoA desaturase (delta-9 desaturase)
MAFKDKQILKFYLTCVLSLAGLITYILIGGTFVKAVVVYVVAWFLNKIAKVGYHRWLSHNQIDPGPVGRFVFLYCMVASALVKPLHYVMGHRIHHKFPDTELDPHPPYRGFFKTLIGDFNDVRYLNVPVKDIIRKKDVMFVNRYYYELYVLHLIFWSLIDFEIVLLSFAFINLRFLFNVAIFNYVTHGGKNGTGPVNLPPWGFYLVGTPGEHLHKNHHDYPTRANFGTVSPCNFDLTYHILKRITKVNE